MDTNDDLQKAFASGYEEAVEVNQRGLIEKILARYSGDYTVFRELLQNADDAQASLDLMSWIGIHFQSNSPSTSITSLSTAPIARILVKNDGIIFREEDWRRLKTVADGQPDSEKIGAFGVGFYSIWSLSDEPLVVSGEQMMLFFWKGQQLAVKRAKNPRSEDELAPNGRTWSSITMPCRAPEPMPDPAAFNKFLATALPFTSSITTMSLHFDGIELCRFDKRPAPARPLTVSQHTNRKTPGKMMEVTSVEEASLQLVCTAKRIGVASKAAPTRSVAQAVKQSFATKFLNFATSSVKTPEASYPADIDPVEKDPAEEISASLFLRIVTSQAKLTASSATISEIERSTKKPPPAFCRLRVLYSSKEEAEASRDEQGSDKSVQTLFGNLTSDLGKQGKIYIGFPLFQTTGCSSAISGRFIPTVEREQIDLQAKAISDYNRELLSVSGITCRIIYDNEMQHLAQRWKSLEGASDNMKVVLYETASHLMQNFTFYQSTPIAEVGRLVQAGFFTSNVRDFLLISTQGVLSASKVRLPVSELSFLPGLATIPESVAKDTGLLLDQLQDRGLIQSVTIDDVIMQLNIKPLSIDEAMLALRWWIELAGNQQYDARLMPRFREALVVTVPAEGAASEQVIPMSTVRNYLNPKNIPPDLPLPPAMLPHAISKSIPWQDLHRVFGISELTMSDWIKYLASESIVATPEISITKSPALSERVLGVLAKVWMNLRTDQSSQIISILRPLACLPTRKGMVIPTEAYLPKVTLFEDLPVTTVQAKGNMEKLLRALGVRDHVDLQLVFSRLLGAGSWDQEQVTKYLVSVADTLSTEEIDKLKKTAWLTKVEDASNNEVQAGKRPPRFKASALYEPSEAHRRLNLPIVAWNTSKWRQHSDEAKFLFRMGLKRYPAIEDILILASDHTIPERMRHALAYFLEHFDSQYASAYSPRKQDLPFVPVIRNSQKDWAKPSEAFSSPGSAVMGFATLDPDYITHASKFKLAADPPTSALVRKLLDSPPGTHDDARPVFAYLAGQASRFTAADHNALASARIIPVQQPDNSIWSLAFPRSVYFQSSENSIPEQFRSLFTFIDYGSTANSFLLQIGVRNEPTTVEMTQMLLDDPRRFLTLAGSADRYTTLLRQIAAQYATFPNNLRKRMQDTPFLLGYERVRTNQTGQTKALPLRGDEDDEEEEGLLQYRLSFARDIVVVDDTTLVNDFREYILTCPQDDMIEAFVEVGTLRRWLLNYMLSGALQSLGGKRISKLVSTNYTSTSIPEDPNKRADGLRKLILERIVLFLHERPQAGKDVRLSEDWLKRNLKIREVARIERQRTLVLGASRVVKSSPASAAATQDKGTLLLRISAAFLDLDYYEIAAALTRLVLAKQKIHDTLLFMTLLQTSLRDLKRRGFNVDKILNARKAEQEAVEQKAREARMDRDRQRITAEQTRTLPPPAYDESQGVSSSVDEPRSGSPLLSDSAATPVPPVSTTSKSLFDSFRQKLRGNPMVPSATGSASRDRISQDSESKPFLDDARFGADAGSRPGPSRGGGRPSGEDVTPQANISTNVIRAIAASRPDRSGNITSQVDTKVVKESASYCDSTPANELDYVTDVAGLRFYVSRNAESSEGILQTHGDALKQYAVSVVKPVGNIFNVDPKALHIFYDGSGPLIAFNRSGSIFFNLRFHLAWHGDEVKRGRLDGALISTYFSMAHELAHNLMLPHNSEHSFYTSQIAQTFFTSMAAHIASLSPPLEA